MPLVMVNLTIPSGESISSGMDCTSGRMIRVRAPDGWDGTDVVTFQLSPDNVVYRNLFDARGAEVTARVVPGTVVMFQQDINPGWMRIRGGTSVNPSVQTVDRTFVVTIDTTPK